MGNHTPAMKHVCSSRNMQRRAGKHGKGTHELNNITESNLDYPNLFNNSCHLPRCNLCFPCWTYQHYRVTIFQPKKCPITTVLTIPSPKSLPRHSISPRGSDVREVRRWNRVAWTMRPRGSSYDAAPQVLQAFWKRAEYKVICFYQNEK